LSEEPAQETGTTPRQGAGNSVTSPGGEQPGRPEPDFTAPPPPDPDALKRNGRRALWLGIGAIFLSLFQAIYLPLGLIFSVLAIVFGVRTVRRARRERGVAPGAVAGVVMGSIGLAVSIPVLSVNLFLRTEIEQYGTCRDAANTITDERACKDAFARSLEEKFNLRKGSLSSEDIPF
jgi:hypothetical protein